MRRVLPPRWDGAFTESERRWEETINIDVAQSDSIKRINSNQLQSTTRRGPFNSPRQISPHIPFQNPLQSFINIFSLKMQQLPVYTSGFYTSGFYFRFHFQHLILTMIKIIIKRSKQKQKKTSSWIRVDMEMNWTVIGRRRRRPLAAAAWNGHWTTPRLISVAGHLNQVSR